MNNQFTPIDHTLTPNMQEYANEMDFLIKKSIALDFSGLLLPTLQMDAALKKLSASADRADFAARDLKRQLDAMAAQIRIDESIKRLEKGIIWGIYILNGAVVVSGILTAIMR